MADENDERKEKRQRKIKRTVRFSAMEDALLRTYASRANLTIASYLRAAALTMPPPKAGRSPSIDREMTAKLIGAMGEAATAFRSAAELADPDLVEAAINDFSEYRIVVFEAMGRAP